MKWYIIFLPIIIIILPLTSCSIDTKRKAVDLKTNKTKTTIRVKAGDTIYSLSKRYQVTMRDLIIENDLSAPFKIFPDQILKFRQPSIHIVVPGETIFSLAHRYGVEVRTLVSFNRLEPPFQIYPGDKVMIPGRTETNVKQLTNLKKVIKNYQRILPFPKPKPTSRGLVLSSNQNENKDENIKTIVKLSVPVSRSEKNFLWPARGRIISNFGPRLGGLHNDGINIAAPKGTPILAADHGVVAYAGNGLKGFGNLILIKHSGGWVTAYAHTEKIFVRRGTQVKRGQKIATVGNTGGVKKPQLHFEVRKGSRAVDPRKELSS
ncbi:MAG: LysM peptidoglycan-binding domain-containing M23 family metallopeptidase [Thalassobaculaceae bacterium]